MIHPYHQLLVKAASVATALLLFARTISGEKVVLTHLIRLVIAAFAAKTICGPDYDDGLPLTGAAQ